MPRRDPKAPQAQERDAERQQSLTELSRALADLAADDADRAAAADRAGEEARAEVELALADLVGDENGEIVLYNDSGARSVAIVTAATVVANGVAQRHVTAGGADVTGYHFVTFDDGRTVYFEGDLDLLVVPEQRTRSG